MSEPFYNIERSVFGRDHLTGSMTLGEVRDFVKTVTSSPWWREVKMAPRTVLVDEAEGNRGGMLSPFRFELPAGGMNRIYACHELAHLLHRALGNYRQTHKLGFVYCYRTVLQRTYTEDSRAEELFRLSEAHRDISEIVPTSILHHLKKYEKGGRQAR